MCSANPLFSNQEYLHGEEDWKNSNAKNGRGGRNSKAKKWEESQRRWKCEWGRERLELDRKLKEHSSFSSRKAEEVLRITPSFSNLQET
ncbi:hypothetical protein Scep_030329 [Stephania cephalantha]|uniref:Uncharacterized protein n=1 Tax=Stephania cephalantha TaxID=152367 RepID=A0AAP0E760_9MAGN